MVKWHHCRACGEEGLTPEDKRCPNCGISAPVTLCATCDRPIREGEPWILTVTNNDLPEDSTIRLQHHQLCYAGGKREARRRYPAPTYAIRQDPRDPHEPLPPSRLLLGMGLILASVFAVITMIASAPKPQPILSPERWDEIARDGTPLAPWVRFWIHSRPGSATFTGTILLIAAIGAGLWMIRWGLARHRSLSIEGMDHDLPPSDSRSREE